MICFEGFLSWRFLGHPPRMDLLPNLARVMALILVVYFVFRVEDLALRGALPAAFSFGMPAMLFWLENVLFVLVPVVIVFRTARRMTTRALFAASLCAVIGFIMLAGIVLGILALLVAGLTLVSANTTIGLIATDRSALIALTVIMILKVALVAVQRFIRP